MSWGVAGRFDLGDLSCKHKHKNNFLTSAKILGGFNLTFRETAFFELRTLKPFLS